MASFIFTNDLAEEVEDADVISDDPFVCAAQHLKPIIDEFKSAEEGQRFHDEFSKEYKDDQMHKCFELFLNEHQLIFKYASDSSDAEKLMKRREEAEGIFTVLLSSMMRFGEVDEVPRLAMKMCDEFMRNGSEQPELKLKILMVLYNMFDVGYSLRFPVFKKIVEFAKQTGQFDKLLPYLKNNLEDWLEDWEPTKEEKRELFKDLSETMRETDRRSQAYDYLKRYLTLFDNEDSAMLADKAVVNAAKTLLRDSVFLPHILQVDDVLAMAAVEALGKTDPGSRALVELLQIFKVGTLDQLKELQRKSPQLFDNEEIVFDQCMSKLRLLTFAEMAVGKSELPLDEIARGLQVSDEEVETWVVRALAQGVVDGRIDQVRRMVLVKSALQRSFTKKEWQFLDTRIDSWIANIESLMGTITTAKAAQGASLGA